MAIEVTSPAFEAGDPIPSRYTCRGENVSPGICWKGTPAGTNSLVLIMEDPDIPLPRFLVPVWTHWIVYNIDPALEGLPEAMPHDSRINGRCLQGMTSFRKPGYGGPCPPFGTHRYIFRVYALDKMLDIAQHKATRRALLNAMQGRVIGQGELTGTFSRTQ